MEEKRVIKEDQSNQNDEIVTVSPQEYRLVPIQNNSDKTEKNTVDILVLLSVIWSERNLILKFVIIGVLFGIFLVVIAPKNYKSSAMLIPEENASQGGASGLIEKYGGLLGIGGGIDFNSNNSIPLQLFPEIVGSLPFQLKLLNQKIYFKNLDTTVTSFQFFSEINKPSLTSIIMQYTVGLPGKLLNSLGDREEKPLPDGFKLDSILEISKGQMKIIESFRKRVVISLDDEAGVIRLTVEMPDEYASANLTMEAIHLLKDYVVIYNTRKATSDLAFIFEQYNNARSNFESANKELALFLDQNINLNTAKARMQEELLRSKYNLSFDIFTSMSQQLEQAKFVLQEQTPVVSILEPAQVPVEDTLSGLKVLMTFLILSVLSGVSYVLFKEYKKELARN
ncbi:MAG: hypothetical protein ACI8Q1_000828 [Parvicella sp.]|jgi:hypothetical protein